MMTSSGRPLLELHIEALFTHDARGRICRINETDGARAPRFCFVRGPDAALWRCRDDLPDETVRALAQLAAAEPVHGDLRAEPRNLDGLLTVLGTHRGRASIEGGPAYAFPDRLPAVEVSRITRVELWRLRRLWPQLGDAPGFESCEPFMAVVDDGFAVSLCHSSRLTAHAAEAGLETLAGYRRRGHAVAVVPAWAAAIRASGRVPLYSTSWDNLASQGVASRLGLFQYATTIAIR